jgi:hypothetical protein
LGGRTGARGGGCFRRSRGFADAELAGAAPASTSVADALALSAALAEGNALAPADGVEAPFGGIDVAPFRGIDDDDPPKAGVAPFRGIDDVARAATTPQMIATPITDTPANPMTASFRTRIARTASCSSTASAGADARLDPEGNRGSLSWSGGPTPKSSGSARMTFSSGMRSVSGIPLGSRDGEGGVWIGGTGSSATYFEGSVSRRSRRGSATCPERETGVIGVSIGGGFRFSVTSGTVSFCVGAGKVSAGNVSGELVTERSAGLRSVRTSTFVDDSGSSAASPP